ncbi:hypothetical protein LTR94_033286, partial [Friedmanniomyces endolithicus]
CKERRRQEQQDERYGRRQSEDDRGRERLLKTGATAETQRQRAECQDRDERRHDDRSKPFAGGFTQAGGV